MWLLSIALSVGLGLGQVAEAGSLSENNPKTLIAVLGGCSGERAQPDQGATRALAVSARWCFSPRLPHGPNPLSAYGTRTWRNPSVALAARQSRCHHHETRWSEGKVRAGPGTAGGLCMAGRRNSLVRLNLNGRALRGPADTAACMANR